MNIFAHKENNRAIWDGMDILSDTNKDDFFDVITKEGE